jgi:Predicted periplasmic or secreted lipoprotein
MPNSYESTDAPTPREEYAESADSLYESEESRSSGSHLEGENSARRGVRSGFRGRGPKNYRRTDERIREDINYRLTENDLLDATDIEVEVSDGSVILDGWVDDGESKRLAEYIAEDVVGVLNVENRLRIKHPTETTPGTFGSIEDLSANYSQKIYGNPAVAIREESEKAENLERMHEQEQLKPPDS